MPRLYRGGHQGGRMNMQLFEGERVRLTPHDPEKDAEIESRWTQN
jgi:hypothetical protein